MGGRRWFRSALSFAATDCVSVSSRDVVAGKPVMNNDRAVAIDTLARTIWGEARGESQTGQEAVANVVVNRVRRRRAG